jgi:hypothetical protein
VGGNAIVASGPRRDGWCAGEAGPPRPQAGDTRPSTPSAAIARARALPPPPTHTQWLLASTRPRLVDAPFIKVEATKYTELGYVG